VLDVGQNKLRVIPNALVHFLNNLHTLNISNNDIDRLPPLLGLHPVLQNISCDGNPLKQIRRAVIDKGPVALKAFLKDKFIKGQDDIVENWALQRE